MAFAYFNNSPAYKAPKPGKKEKKWKYGDCAVRAIACATGMSWVDTYKFASESALKVFEPFNCTIGFNQVMEDLGFEKWSYPRGTKRETVADFAENHKDEVAILVLAGHYVCCKDGNYYDVFDSGYMTAYSYYVLPKDKQ